MPTNNFLPFCPTDTGTNLETQVAYAADTQRTNGNQPGIASSKLVNKAIRQATWIASQFAQYLANVTGNDVLDDQNATNILNTMTSALTSGFNIKSKTSAYSAAAKDYVICSSASFNVTLPDATAVGVAGLQISIQHNGTNFSQVYTLLTTSAQTIGGIASGSYALYTTGETLVVISDGANWQIVAHRTQTAWVDAGVITPTCTSAYVFTIASSTVTTGAVYSNNSQNFYVTLSISSLTTLTCSGTGAPGASGTLTLVSGSGPATIAFSAVVTSIPNKGTATIPTDHTWWRRNGQMLEGRIEFNMTANGTAATGTGDYLFWPLSVYNANVTFDSSVMTFAGGSAWLNSVLESVTGGVGGGWVKYGSQAGTATVSAYDSTKLRVTSVNVAPNFSSGTAAAISNANMGFNAAAPTYSLYYSIPITGWRP